MPINFPMFQGGQVPLPRPIQPFQQPQHYDPATIIMHAAELHQQRQLAEQQMNMRAVENVTQAAQAAAALREHQREADMSNQLAQMTQQMAAGKLEPEKALLAAHANYFNAQANLMGSSDLAEATFPLTQPGPNGEPPRMTFEQWGSMFPRGLAKIQTAKAVANAAKENPNINAMTGDVEKAAQLEKAKVQYGAQNFNQIKTTEQITQQLKNLADLNSQIPRSNFTAINRYGLGAAANSGDPTASLLTAQAGLVSQTEQRLYAQGSDRRFDNIQNQIASSKSQDQLDKNVRLLYSDYINNRNIRTNSPYGYLTDNEKGAGLYTPNISSLIPKNPQAPGSLIMRLFGGGNQSQAVQAPGQSVPGGGNMMRVRRKVDGAPGTINQSDFDGSKYEAL